MTKVSVMGIDPGAKGAIAILSNDPPTVELHLLNELDWWHFDALIRQHEIKHIYLEQVQSMPGNAGASMLKYGIGFGRLLGWMEASEIPHTQVRPHIWSKSMHAGCTAKDAKSKSLEVAQRLFPRERLTMGRGTKPHDGLVDALLIAEYGRRIFK